MRSEVNCARLIVSDALAHLPGPAGKRFATIFERGSLMLEIYAPRGTDPQSLTHAMRSISLPLDVETISVVRSVTRLAQPTCYSRQPVQSIVLRTSRTIWWFGLSSTVLRVVKANNSELAKS